MEMTQDQFGGLVRAALQVAGAAATIFGIMSVDQVSVVTTWLLDILGPTSVLGGAIWSWISNSKKSLIQSVAAMDETSVDGNKITVHDRTLATAAAVAATPAKK